MSLTKEDIQKVVKEELGQYLGEIRQILETISSLNEKSNSSHVEKVYQTPSSQLHIIANHQERVSNGNHFNFESVDELSTLSRIKTSNGGVLEEIHMLSREDIIRHVESEDTKLKSFLKLAISFAYCSIVLFITAFVMVIVHSRVPDMQTYKPLPDLFLDAIPLIPYAFEASECIAILLMSIWVTVLIFHKSRVIALRRMFSLVGSVFLLRCVTMLITSLSVPGVHLDCKKKEHDNLKDQLAQAFKIFSNFGMAVNDVRTCGDYLFSGHTSAITLLNLFITEYTPASWNMLHTMTWILNFFAIFFILAGHEHYSIDIAIAFFLSSRMFLYYHAYAYNLVHLTNTDSRVRLWFPLGWFFESGSVGRVENEYEWPLPINKIIRLFISVKKSVTQVGSPVAAKKKSDDCDLSTLLIPQTIVNGKVKRRSKNNVK
uniref:PAP2_C domain-containing protein n=1 Tax=Rhabditophanes sp. KR3021 TaxID=114890 RepID=A0AC35UD78_9BILA